MADAHDPLHRYSSFYTAREAANIKAAINKVVNASFEAMWGYLPLS